MPRNGNAHSHRKEDPPTQPHIAQAIKQASEKRTVRHTHTTPFSADIHPHLLKSSAQATRRFLQASRASTCLDSCHHWSQVSHTLVFPWKMIQSGRAAQLRAMAAILQPSPVDSGAGPPPRLRGVPNTIASFLLTDPPHPPPTRRKPAASD